MARRSKPLHCSFCGQTQDAVNKLLAGPRVHICGHCVGLCNDILDAEGTSPFANLSDLSEQDILVTLKPTGVAAESLHALVRDRVDELRAREVSWARIGKALDVSRQAAWERFS